jgi:hypothetical protein
MSLESIISALLSAIIKSEFPQQALASIMDKWRTSQFKGAYDVHTFYATFELLDKKGHLATYTKRAKVRFLQNLVFAIQDQAWGDGNIFAEYRCTPGVPVDKYQEGYRQYVVISLRRNYQKGDVQELVTERTIEDGFLSTNETFQIQVDYPTKELSTTIIFPKGRHPKSIAIVENNLKLSHQLGKDHETSLPDGRVSYTWWVKRPRLFEGYIFKWEW